MKPRNLVIKRAGSRSLHERWLTPTSERNFDVLVASYIDPKIFVDHPGVTVRHIPGRKVEGWRKLMEQYGETIEAYDQIAFIDDDIDCKSSDISQCFNLGNQYKLSIWQPSLSWTSYFTYAGLLNNPKFILRYVNYIEMMCPFFSIETLKAVKPLFSMGWESGIDLVWCSISSDRKHRYAIIDDVQIHHTRPVGRDKASNGFIGRDYEDDIYACLQHFEMSWPSLVAEAGITKDGRTVSKLGICMRLPFLFGVVMKTPNERTLRLLMDHIRHQLFRKASYGNNASGLLMKNRLRT